MLVVLRFTVDAGGHDTGGLDTGGEAFVAEAREALSALAACPGYVNGQIARAYDDPRQWCLVTEWASVGAYRRALGAYEVKLRATVLLGRATPEPSAFEVLATAEPGGAVSVRGSDRAEPTGEGDPARLPSRP